MEPLPSFDIDGTIGALEIGVFLSYILFGVETMQAYIYYGRFPDDCLYMKILVAMVWTLELGHVISTGHSLYAVSVSAFGHPERFVRAPNSMAVALLLSGVIIAPGVLRGSNIPILATLIVPCLCGVLSFLRLLGCGFLFVFAIRMTSTAQWAMQWSWLLNSVWAISSANDIILAVGLTHALWTQRALTENARTMALVDKIMKWTLETGAMTSVTGIMILITFLTMQDNYIWVAWYVVTAKLYSNALFATLNSRTTLRALDASEIILGSTAPARGRETVKATMLAFATPDRSEVSTV